MTAFGSNFNVLIYEDVFRQFQNKRLDYIIVGGIAANLLGFVRATADLDILIDISSVNIRKTDALLRALGYKIKVPVDISKLDNEYLSVLIKTKHMKALNYYKNDQISEVDIIVDSPVSFAQAKKRAKILTVRGLKLPVVCIDDLIRMKTKTGRAVDKYDVAELKKLRRLIGR